MKTMICLILDRSGSMTGRETDVVGGVNKFLEEQKALPNPASLAMVRFDDGHEGVERFRAMKSLAEVQPLRPNEYQPRGNTPLLDAVGKTITQLDEDWKAEKPDRCIVLIVTDGEENASHEYTKAKVQALIKARQDSNLWAFIYLGANVDAFHEAAAMGIATSNTAGYTSSAKGTSHAYKTASASVATMRSTGSTVADNLGVANLGEGEDDDAPSAAAPASWTPPAPLASTPSTPAAGAWTPPA